MIRTSTITLKDSDGRKIVPNALKISGNNLISHTYLATYLITIISLNSGFCNLTNIDTKTTVNESI